MIQYERQQEILEVLKKRKTVSVKELAKEIYTSEASVRRDVKVLENGGFVHTVYGGVVLAEYMDSVMPIAVRDGKNSVKKEIVAEKAVKMIFDGAVIIMDSSSTVRRMCKYIRGFSNLKIITNSLSIFDELHGYSLYCTGGKYLENDKVFVGSGAERYLESINADLMFFSSQGISDDGEITDVSEEETSIRQVMMKRADKKIFLCDSSKIGVRKMLKLCDKNDVDTIICDEKLPWEE